MTFATLNTIHNLMMEELKHKNGACDLARKNRDARQAEFENLQVSGTKSEIFKAKSRLITIQDVYDNIRKSRCNIENAISEFENHDWH